MDIALFNLIHSLAGSSDALDVLGIFLAKYLAYFFVLFFIGAILFIKDRQRRIAAVLYSLLSFFIGYGLIKYTINFFLYRDRPFVSGNFAPLIDINQTAAMPSGHALTFFLLSTIIYLVVSRRVGGWLYVFAFLIGIGRIYAGVHYPLDILAGAIIGILTAILVRLAFFRLTLPAPVKREVGEEQML